MSGVIDNGVLRVIASRSSTRDYMPDPVPRDAVEALETAALEAPTSLDRQEQKFIFVTDPALIREMEHDIAEKAREAGETDYLERLAMRDGKVFFGAPLVIVVSSRTENDYTAVDAGIAAQTICLAAESMGLGSVIMAAPDRIFLGEEGGRWRSRLGMEPGWRFEISVAVGYPRTRKAPHTIDRRNIREI
ncbi:MAG: nitroreductase family protein [Oscillospiraceae bacterium]|jgi:nitroreductase